MIVTMTTNNPRSHVQDAGEPLSLGQQGRGVAPAPPISLVTWDEKTNPFAVLLDEHLRRRSTNDGTADPQGELSCLRALAEAFSESVMAGTSSPGPKEQAGLSEARRHWQRRVMRLSARAARVAVAPLAGEQAGWEHLVNAYPWQRTPRQPVTLWESPCFARPFSAVGPAVSMIFAAPDLLRTEDPVLATQFIHELGHIEDGQILGWQSFQSRDARAVESPAVSAELRFLQSLLKQSGVAVAWQDSPLRLAWNVSYGRTPWTSAEEAMTYLHVIENLDPL